MWSNTCTRTVIFIHAPDEEELRTNRFILPNNFSLSVGKRDGLFEKGSGGRFGIATISTARPLANDRVDCGRP
jgi:hypothetical protein